MLRLIRSSREVLVVNHLTLDVLRALHQSADDNVPKTTLPRVVPGALKPTRIAAGGERSSAILHLRKYVQSVWPVLLF